MPPDEARRIANAFSSITAQKEPFILLENINLHKDGHQVVLETSGVPFFDRDGNVQGYRGIDRDITERKRLEEELIKIQKLESVGVLAGGIAHDFNNLLTGIMGNISLAKMFLKPENKAFKRLTEAENASMRAKDLTHQLITFSMGGAPIKKTTDIVELIKGSVSFALRGSNIRCEFLISDASRPVEVDGG